MRGAPDYGQFDYPVSPSEISNDSIISAALGFSPLDIRGRIVVLDTFKEGLFAWGLNAVNGASTPAIEIANLHSFISPMGVVFKPNGVGGYAYMDRTLRLAGVKKVGLECGWWIGLNSGCSGVLVQIDNPALGFITAGIRYRSDTGVFEKYSGGTWNNAGLVSLVTGFTVGWIPFKVVVDISTGYYSHMIFAHQRYDFPANTPTHNGVSFDPYRTVITLQCEGVGAAVNQSYLGYVIITRDEP